MEVISQLLQLTLDSQDERSRVDAETKLKEGSTQEGFLPVLMRMIVMEEIPVPVRQAAVIYMKNMIGKNWKEREMTSESTIFTICEADKKFIRDSIIEAVISANSDLIRRQLTVCVQEILSFDFPERWAEVPAKLQAYLTTDKGSEWHGALLVLYQLVKKYEYKREAEREPVIVVMAIFLPLLQNRCTSLTKIDSPDACTLVALIFKIFRSLIQLNLPLQLINENNMPQWMGLFKAVLESPIPMRSEEAEPEERPLLPCWKVRKWAITLINKIFDRYGLVGSVEKPYVKFADFYDKNYSESMTQLVLKILDAHRKGVYVSPRVLHHALSYLTCGVYNSRSWKVVKPHLDKMVEEVVFPLMCHSDEDEELWQDDPQDYIRSKYDVFEDFLLFSPNEAAKAYLVRAAEKRKDVLKPVVVFISKIFDLPKELRNDKYPRQKDGALHMMGALAEALTKKKIYKKEMQPALTNYILPEFGSTFGFLRARACWVVQQFSVMEFTSEEVLDTTIKCVLGALTDVELPVQVEAGIAIKHLIENQDEKSTDLIRPNVQPLITSILDVLNRSENDELTGTIAKLVECFPEEVKDIAVLLVTQLSQTFMTLVTSEDDYDNKSVTAMGVLETLQTVMGELEEKAEIIQQLEQVVYQLIITVLEKELMEFYEEIFSLINECTVVKISATMWNLLEVLHATLHNDTSDYFTEMMPCLHNYVTVDPETFLKNEKYCQIIFNMCQKMLQEKCGEDAEMQAAKLIEVIILQYQGQMNGWLPRFIQLALERLTSELRTSELRVMLIQVIIAALMSSPSIVLGHLTSLNLQVAPHGMVAEMLSLWLKDTDCFLGLHDRKVYVLGMCALLEIPPQERPQSLVEAAAQLLPNLLIIFDGLNHIYEKINKVEDEDEDIEEDENGELGDSDDEYDEDGLQQVEKCERLHQINIGEIEDDDWENDLDVFTTPIDDNLDIDEYVRFKTSFQLLEEREKHGLFTLMTQSLNEEQMGAIQQVINEGIRREKATESRRIEAAGGFTFNQTTVDPKNFSFGGGLS